MGLDAEGCFLMELTSQKQLAGCVHRKSLQPSPGRLDWEGPARTWPCLWPGPLPLTHGGPLSFPGLEGGWRAVLPGGITWACRQQLPSLWGHPTLAPAWGLERQSLRLAVGHMGPQSGCRVGGGEPVALCANPA